MLNVLKILCTEKGEKVMHVEMEPQLGFKLGQMPSREVCLSVCQIYSVLLYHSLKRKNGWK